MSAKVEKSWLDGFEVEGYDGLFVGVGEPFGEGRLPQLRDGWGVPFGQWEGDAEIAQRCGCGLVDGMEPREQLARLLALRVRECATALCTRLWFDSMGEVHGMTWKLRVTWGGSSRMNRIEDVSSALGVLRLGYSQGAVPSCRVDIPLDSDGAMQSLCDDGEDAGFVESVLALAIGRMVEAHPQLDAMLSQALRRQLCGGSELWSVPILSSDVYMDLSRTSGSYESSTLYRGDGPRWFGCERDRLAWVPLWSRRMCWYGRHGVGNRYSVDGCAVLSGIRSEPSMPYLFGQSGDWHADDAGAMALYGADAFTDFGCDGGDVSFRLFAAASDFAVSQRPLGGRSLSYVNVFEVLACAERGVWESAVDAWDGSPLPEPRGVLWDVVALPPAPDGSGPRFTTSEHLEKMDLCGACGGVIPHGSGVLCDGEVVCEDCRDTMTAEGDMVECDGCGSYTSSTFDGACDPGAWVDDGVYCQSCYDERFGCCDSCGETFYRDDLVDTEDSYGDNVTVCESCAERYNGAIRSYSYKPDPVFHHHGMAHQLYSADGALYYGLEIETGGGYASDFAERCASRFGGLMYYKHDSSISDEDEDCEVVTHPMTYRYAMDVDWDGFHSDAVAEAMRSHDLGTCGLHIHVSRKGLGSSYDQRELNAAKLVVFFDEHYDELVRFSRRKPSAASEWARKNDCGVCDGDGDDEVRSKGKSRSRYCAVNTQPMDTVEIRLWRGTTKASTIRSTIDMTDAIVHYCIDTPTKKLIADAGRSLWELLGGRLRDETKAYMTVRGLNPVADVEPDGEND